MAHNVTKEDLKSDNDDDVTRAIYFGPFIAFAAIVELFFPVEHLFYLIPPISF